MDVDITSRDIHDVSRCQYSVHILHLPFFHYVRRISSNLTYTSNSEHLSSSSAALNEIRALSLH